MTRVSHCGKQDRTVATEGYYTIDGRRVAQPAPGLYVKVIEYTDGSRESVKAVVK